MQVSVRGRLRAPLGRAKLKESSKFFEEGFDRGGEAVAHRRVVFIINLRLVVVDSSIEPLGGPVFSNARPLEADALGR